MVSDSHSIPQGRDVYAPLSVFYRKTAARRSNAGGAPS